MIDHHCHLLPGLDDGARDLAEALAMARLLAAAGYRTVHCTPHRMPGSYPTEPEQVRTAVAGLQAALDGEGIDLRLEAGMEYYLDEHFLDLDELLPLGASDRVLVEAPSQAHAPVVAAGLEKLRAAGLVAAIAHPERSEVFVCGPGGPTLAGSGPLPAGTLFQGNLGSFTGHYGPAVLRRAYQLLRAGAYHLLGSDGHRSAGLAAVLAAARDKFLVNPALCRLAGLDALGIRRAAAG